MLKKVRPHTITHHVVFMSLSLAKIEGRFYLFGIFLAIVLIILLRF